MSLPIALMGLAMARAWPVQEPVSSRIVLLMFGATLLNLARAVIVGRPITALACFIVSSLAAGWTYRKAVQGEIMTEDFERRRRERELDES